MPTDRVPWLVQSALRAVINEDFIVKTCNQLPSKRNKVFHITGMVQETKTTYELAAKLYQQTGIAHETTVLRQAYSNNIHVPRVLGTTEDVILMEFIQGLNLCDIITDDPSPQYGVLLGQWFTQYHSAFQRIENHVLLKGDARIRNFIFKKPHLYGVDFEESYIGPYPFDLAVVCGSILDTDPIFTDEKLKLCHSFITTYAESREIDNEDRILENVTPHLIKTLKETAKRRGNPKNLVDAIAQFESGKLVL
jgi:tRNA A-37 threonylcarbamoyl transferase component Bud32